METHTKTRLLRGTAAAETIGFSRQRFYDYLNGHQIPPPTQEISTIAYWRSDIMELFAEGLVQKDLDGDWIFTETGKLIPYSLQRSYGYVPTKTMSAAA